MESIKNQCNTIKKSNREGLLNFLVESNDARCQQILNGKMPHMAPDESGKIGCACDHDCDGIRDA